LSPTYTGNWLFSELHHLAILRDSIKPWPMTLAPTNETIRHEIMRKKLMGKKDPYDLGISRLGVWILFIKLV
jgi:hypothetical protein